MLPTLKSARAGSPGKHRDPGRVEYTVQTFHHGVAEGREEGLDRETLMAQM